MNSHIARMTLRGPHARLSTMMRSNVRGKDTWNAKGAGGRGHGPVEASAGFPGWLRMGICSRGICFFIVALATVSVCL